MNHLKGATTQIDGSLAAGCRTWQSEVALQFEFGCCSVSTYEGVAHEFFGMGLVVKDAAAQTRVTLALKKGLRHGLLGKIADALS